MSLSIDRPSFLAFTVGIAGACNPGPGVMASGSVVEIPRQPPQPPDAGAAPLVVRTDDTAKLRAPAKPANDDDDEEAEPTLPTARDTPVTGCGWVDPATVSRPSGKCSDDQGAAPACSSVKTCTGSSFAKTKCESYRKNFKAKVAQKALDCMAKLTAKQVCDACGSYRCGDLALKGACPDAAADATCTQITSKCSSVSMGECSAYLAGMNASGRAQMLACLSGPTGCRFGLYVCSEGL
jgi:hypothetical protein